MINILILLTKLYSQFFIRIKELEFKDFYFQLRSLREYFRERFINLFRLRSRRLLIWTSLLILIHFNY